MSRINFIPNDYILRKHPNISWRKWLEMVWNDIEWPVVAFLSMASLVLGIIGFSQYQQQAYIYQSFWNNLYQSLQLFSLQVSFDKNIPIPICLQVARFLSPALAAYTLSQAFVVIFKEQLELFRLVRMSNHVVVCGLGQKGLLLTNDLRKANRAVVVIEQNSNNPHVATCRELGAIVVIGDARDSRILLKAGIQDAEYLFAVCGKDGTNIEVAEQTKTLIQEHKDRKRLFTCVLHITDLYLWVLLRERVFSNEQNSLFRLDQFNVYDTGARILLRETLQKYTGKSPHLLIIGMGELAEHLIVHSAQNWCLGNRKANQKLMVSLVDPEVKQKLPSLEARFPLVSMCCKFNSFEYRTNSLAFQTGAFLQLPGQKSPVTHVFICFDDTTLGLQAGFTLLRLLQEQRIQIMVRMTEDAGLATFLREMKKTPFENISAFGLLDRTCRLGLLDDGTHEALARVIHEDYLARELYKSLTTENNQNLVPWENLSDEIKESNRRQAGHIGLKLAAITCGIELWNEYGKENFIFKFEEILVMAKIEHERWCEDKKLAGWRYGENRDDNQKLHPDLVGWDNGLTDNAKEKDIAAVKLIPSLLARAGFQIYRFPKSVK